MTEQERTRLKARIVELIAEQERSIAELEKTSAPVSLDQPIGRLSRMDSLVNQGISGRVLAETRARLTRLKQALARIDEPGFGLCEECDEEIALNRLLAMPEATLCIHCAE